MLEEGHYYEPLEAFKQVGKNPNIKYTIHDDYAIMTMVEAGLGISILAELVLRRTNYHISLHQTEPPIYRTLAIGYKDEEIPYMIMPLLKLETNPIMNTRESSVVLDICEKAAGSICIVLMTFVVHKNATIFSMNEKSEKIFFVLAFAVLLANFIGWALYFTGHQGIFVMMFFIVLLPPLYYLFIGAWRKNISLVAAGSIFLIVHFIHVLGNLKN